MSYPLPMTKNLKTSSRFSIYSSPFGLSGDPSIDRSLNTCEDQTNNESHVSFAEQLITNQINDSEKLIEMLSNVLNNYQLNKANNQDDSQLQNDLPMKTNNNKNKNDIYIYVRRKGDFQVSYFLFFFKRIKLISHSFSFTLSLSPSLLLSYQ